MALTRLPHEPLTIAKLAELAFGEAPTPAQLESARRALHRLCDTHRAMLVDYADDHKTMVFGHPQANGVEFVDSDWHRAYWRYVELDE